MREREIERERGEREKRNPLPVKEGTKEAIVYKLLTGDVFR